jgi:hypothetical protein
VSVIFQLDISDWYGEISGATAERATSALEEGRVLFLPRLSFSLSESEHRFLTPSWSDERHKNISLDERGERLGGARGQPGDLAELRALMARFAAAAGGLMDSLHPRYGPYLRKGRTSFRPSEIAGRASSPRKDDSRLHVDAFPSSPVGGLRILRVFTNVNREQEGRLWRIGEPFEAVAQRFLPRIRPPLPGSAWLLHRLRVTRRLRSRYDDIMLQLHNQAKADSTYQRDMPQESFDFPPGTTWICYTDQVMHAAMRGRGALEQTFYLPVQAMRHPEMAPLRVLERLTGRMLAPAELSAPLS